MQLGPGGRGEQAEQAETYPDICFALEGTDQDSFTVRTALGTRIRLQGAASQTLDTEGAG